MLPTLLYKYISTVSWYYEVLCIVDKSKEISYDSYSNWQIRSTYCQFRDLFNLSIYVYILYIRFYICIYWNLFHWKYMYYSTSRRLHILHKHLTDILEVNLSTLYSTKLLFCLYDNFINFWNSNSFIFRRNSRKRYDTLTNIQHVH